MWRHIVCVILPLCGLGLAAPVPAGASPVVSASDPQLDDYGPGDYLYPVHPYFYRRGVFDLTAFRVRDAGRHWEFEVEVALQTPRPVETRATLARPLRFEQDIYFQNFDIYIRTPDADAAEGDVHDAPIPGRNFRFADGHEWNHAVVLTPFPFQVESLIEDWPPADQAQIPSNVQRIGPRYTARVPKAAFGSSSPKQWRFAVVVTGAIPLVQGFVRADDDHPNALTMPVRPNPGPEFFGGSDLGPFNPAVIDLLAPTKKMQRELLAADAPDRRREFVKLPLLSIEELAGPTERE